MLLFCYNIVWQTEFQNIMVKDVSNILFEFILHEDKIQLTICGVKNHYHHWLYNSWWVLSPSTIFSTLLQPFLIVVLLFGTDFWLLAFSIVFLAWPSFLYLQTFFKRQSWGGFRYVISWHVLSILWHWPWWDALYFRVHIVPEVLGSFLFSITPVSHL